MVELALGAPMGTQGIIGCNLHLTGTPEEILSFLPLDLNLSVPSPDLPWAGSWKAVFLLLLVQSYLLVNE